VGLRLLENSAATAAGLFAIILMFGPFSGGRFNPVVSLADAAFGGLSRRAAAAYVALQVAGAVLARTHRTQTAPAAARAYICAAYWFTSSTRFANPAISVG
jgi:arsenate reductase (thioredoxin)